MTQIGDGQRELLFPAKEKNEALMAADCWKLMGEKAFEDPALDNAAKDETAKEDA